MANKTKKRGLGSPNMDKKTKHDIQSKGGAASHQNAQDENLDENMMMEDEEFYSELRMPKSQDDVQTTTQDTGLSEELDPGMNLGEDWEEEDKAA